MAKDPFTINKAKVRELDFILIQRFFKKRKGDLRYLGLPASTLVELIKWNDWFSHFSAIERGKSGEESIEQHNLMLTAFRFDLSDKLLLLRGEMDDILINGKDHFENYVPYPFDVVSLDYSGGLVYKDQSGRAKRTQSISNLLSSQSEHNKDFLLFISTNFDYVDEGEINRVLQDIDRELNKIGVRGSATIKSILENRQNESRLKVYVPYIIKSLTAQYFKCEFHKPVFYSGNRSTRMVHFSFSLQRTSNYLAGKPNVSDIVEILNLPAFICTDGNLVQTDFGIPKIDL